MKFLVILSSIVLIVHLSLAQRQGMHKMKGDYMDVPLRAGYRIMGSDDDGFLEDGIIVKQKGTGYIDQRFRNREPVRDQRASASQIIYGRPVWFRQ